MSLPGLFIVGTDTGVGKTRVTASAVRAPRTDGRRVGVLKPVLTGAGPGDDVDVLREAAGGVPRDRVSRITFDEPLAPPIAARRGGFPLTQSAVEAATFDALDWWSERADFVVVEGIGGLLCPLAEGSTVADLAIALDFPMVIVARRRLGTLNHTLLTVEAARARSLRVAGLVLNSPEPETGDVSETACVEELARRLPGVAILAVLGHQAGSSPGPLTRIDWFSLARPSRRNDQGRVTRAEEIAASCPAT